MPTFMGNDCKLYINTGTYGSPTWAVVDLVKDITVADSRAEGDSTVRGYDLTSVTPGMRTLQVSGEIKYDAADTAFDALYDAYVADPQAVIGCLILDGPIATAGKKGKRFDAYVTQWGDNEPLNQVKTVPFTLSATTDAAHGVEAYTAAP
jgi:hypothetical protein